MANENLVGQFSDLVSKASGEKLRLEIFRSLWGFAKMLAILLVILVLVGIYQLMSMAMKLANLLWTSPQTVGQGLYEYPYPMAGVLLIVGLWWLLGKTRKMIKP